MTNQALPKKSRELLSGHSHECQNLGLMLDKFAPWAGSGDGWDLTVNVLVRKANVQKLHARTGGEAKGIWLDTDRKAKDGETKSLFESPRVDEELMQHHRERWKLQVQQGGGRAFKLELRERLAAGLGASHVLETSLALDRNTGLPYLPASSVKGLARAWGLIEVAAQLRIKIDPNLSVEKQPLNQLADTLITEPQDTLFDAVNRIIHADSSADAQSYLEWFRFVFGWAGSKHDTGQAGSVCFTDAIYCANEAPTFVKEVMTPHYVDYFDQTGYPSEDKNPKPISFLTVERGQSFAFGIIPRADLREISEDQTTTTALEIAEGWLISGLSRLGAGSKTSSGYGFFSNKPNHID